MEIKLLKTFLTVAKVESFSRSAEILDYAQSSISAQIQLLEEDLETKLFERLGRKIKLTAEGRKLLIYAEQMLKLDAEAREIISDSPLPKGTLRIGASESLCISYLPPLLKEYRRRYPEVEIILKLGGASELCCWLMENSIDIAFYMDRQISSEMLTAETLFDEAMVVLAAAEHQIVDRIPINPADLNGMDLILTESGNSYRVVMEGILAEAAIRLGSVMECGSIEAIKKLVISGLGITLLPRVVVEEELHKGQLIDLKWQGPDFQIKNQVVYHKNKWLTRALKAMMELVHEVYTIN